MHRLSLALGKRSIAVSVTTLLTTALTMSVNAQQFTDVSDRLVDEPAAGRTLYGASLIDVNADGRPDIYQPGSLFIQQADGTFRDLLRTPRFEEPDGSEVFGGIFADVDADGFPELYVEDFDPGSRFFRNRSGLRFDRDDASGIDMAAAQSQGAVWADLDLDSDLDLFVGEEFGHNRWYRNDGTGRFVVQQSPALLNNQKSYGVAAADYDQDGDMDVFIAACALTDPDRSINVLFRNNGDGTFTDVAAEAGVDDNLAGWASVWLDYDRDGQLDLYVANMPVGGQFARPGTNTLYRNLGDGTFVDVGSAAGVANPDDASFGASVADFDNDGWEDIYVANDFGPHRLYHNNTDGSFTDVLPDLGLGAFQATIAVAAGDIDGDGWVDLFTGSSLGNRLLRNTGSGSHWLAVRLRGDGLNRNAVGARVRVWTGNAVQQRTITAGDGMTSQNHSLMAHFGMGQSAVADSVRVDWPSGVHETFYGLSTDRTLHAVEGEGLNEPPRLPVLISPPDAAVDPTELAASADPDSDGDQTTCTIAVAAEGDFTDDSLIDSTIDTGCAAVSTAGLAPGRYWWSATASDGHWIRNAGPARWFEIVGTVGTAGRHELPESGPELIIYPNPSTGRITVQRTTPLGEFLQIIDVTGREVMSVYMEPYQSEVFLRLEGLAPGLYLVRTRSGLSRSFVHHD